MKDYPKYYEELKKQMRNLGHQIPDTMKAFGALHKVSVGTGILSTKNKELIALGIAIAVGCDGCIAFHVHDTIKVGAST